ncbi:MAG: NADPH:quinone oxidoreductase family protein [Pseudomonadota bacterium]
MIAQKSTQWQALSAGAPLERQSVPIRDPKAREVRIRVAACGLNFADTLMLAGRYQEQPQPPIVPGMEISGWIDALGPQVAGLAQGARVAVFAGSGGLADYVYAPAEACVLLPDSVDLDAGAAFQVVYGTAHLALWHRARLRHGERLVVTGAAGGTGLASVQVGALLGAEVVAIARGPEKLRLAQKAGATHLIDAAAPDLRAQIQALGGADVAIDTVGTPLWDALLRSANPEARLFPLGFAGGEVPQIKANHLLVKNLSVYGFYWGGYRHFAPGVFRDSLAHVLDWIATGALDVRIGARVPFDRADEGLDMIRNRQARGKIVVTLPVEGFSRGRSHA